VTAEGGTTPKRHDGWMRDLTVQDDHDFYVEPAVALPPVRAGQAEVAVLVHNCGGTRFSVDSAGTVTDSQGSAGIQLNKASGDGSGIP
jgi:hypothetical protein